MVAETQPEITPEERTKANAKAAVPVDVKVICKCKAVYEYAAVNREEEIDLLEGDVIAVEYKVLLRFLAIVSAFV